MARVEANPGAWTTPDRLGGDITNPRSGGQFTVCRLIVNYAAGSKLRLLIESLVTRAGIREEGRPLVRGTVQGRLADLLKPLPTFTLHVVTWR